MRQQVSNQQQLRCDGVPTVFSTDPRCCPTNSVPVGVTAQSKPLNVKTATSRALFAASKPHSDGSTVIAPGWPRKYLRIDLSFFMSLPPARPRLDEAFHIAGPPDPQQFANQLSIHSLPTLWQLFFVVLSTLPAQSSRNRDSCHVGAYLCATEHERRLLSDDVDCRPYTGHGTTNRNICWEPFDRHQQNAKI